MNSDEWQQIKTLFSDALKLPQEKRKGYLKRRTDKNTVLFNHVMQMLEVESEQKLDISDAISSEVSDLLNDQFTLKIGSKVGVYQIRTLIGQGGMGKVYLAQRADQEFDQQVAIKIIDGQSISNDAIQRFQKERQILADLRHPNIAQLIDGGTIENGLPYIILEYIQGLPLLEYITSNQLNLEQRLALIIQVCSAIDFAHQNLVVHRDIKPMNIMVTKEGVVKLLDFGIAKLLQSEQRPSDLQKTQQGVKLMTPGSASPEQVLGEQITTRTDVYGLGALLFHVLTETPLFSLESETRIKLEKAICDKTPENPSDIVNKTDNKKSAISGRQLKGDLDTITSKALQKNPQRRYQSVAQFSEDIERYLSHHPIKARPDSLAYRVKKYFVRNTALAVTSSVFAISVILFFTYIGLQSVQIKKQKENAFQEAAISNQVVEFMVETFQAANPIYHQGKAFDAELLLDAASEKIEQLERTPITKARLLLTLGRSYEKMGVFDKALPIIVQSVKLTSEEEVIDHRVIAKSLLFLGELQFETNDYINSIDSLTKSINHYEQLLSENRTPNKEDEMAKSSALSSLAATVGELDQLDKSEKLELQSLAIVIKYYGEDSSQAAEIYISLGHIYRHKNELTKAKQILIKGLKAFRASRGPLDLDLALSLNQLSRTMSFLQEYEEALPLAQEGLMIRRKIYKRAHAEIAASLGNVSSILEKLNRFEEAEKTRRESLTILTNLFGESHYYVAGTLSNLGRLLYQLGKIDQAEQSFEKALEIMHKTLPADNTRRAFPLVQLGRLNLGRKNYDRAESYLQEAYNIRIKFLEKNHWRTIETSELLAKVFEQQKKYSKAKELILAVYNAKLASFGEEDQRVQKLKKDWPQYLVEK